MGRSFYCASHRKEWEKQGKQALQTYDKSLNGFWQALGSRDNALLSSTWPRGD